MNWNIVKNPYSLSLIRLFCAFTKFSKIKCYSCRFYFHMGNPLCINWHLLMKFVIANFWLFGSYLWKQRLFISCEEFCRVLSSNRFSLMSTIMTLLSHWMLNMPYTLINNVADFIRRYLHDLIERHSQSKSYVRHLSSFYWNFLFNHGN